ncbi:class I SAM-dependent RNA methyltransferase [Georgenia faecalis]|uniref:Class I SAM-dependent RNA methyltransferase n=1 Tax=Georgenia faecalis TaxID=2483799 RepID=A0ABV9DB40_9MICO|nr:TRAM domain-containing protein [Georgenia faecalis]
MSTPGPDLVELVVGPPAHGGHCVARSADGPVVFVRHTLPGERVRARVTQARRQFWRADAVEVLEASPDRVPSVWPEAGPGGVGGGELAHVALDAQRRWKTTVLREALTRIGHLDLDGLEGEVAVEGLPGDDEAGGLGTRTRIELVVDADGTAGMFRHRSHDVVPLSSMPLAVPAIAELGLFAPGRWSHLRPGTRLDVVAPSVGAPLVLVDGEPEASGRGPARGSVREVVPTAFGDLTYRVRASGFWQVHRRAAPVLVDAVLGALRPTPGERLLDLYSGAGLFTLPLVTAVGESGRVDAVESEPRAVTDARRNLHAHAGAALHEARVDPASLVALGGDPVDGVVLDPPRAGAGPAVMDALADLAPQRVVYVACDPAALARDLQVATARGYRLRTVRGLDLFPHTHHVEAVALLERA